MNLFRELFIDFKPQGLNPDGAICDANGNIWIAFWGASNICGYNVEGQKIGEYCFSATQVSCPALGGALFNELFATTAAEHLPPEQARAEGAGKLYKVVTDIQGLPEYKVLL